MQMNEDKIVEEIKQLNNKLEQIKNINKLTNVLLVLILFLFFLISFYNGFLWS